MKIIFKKEPTKLPNKGPTNRQTYKETDQLTNPGNKIGFFAHKQKMGCGYFF